VADIKPISAELVQIYTRSKRMGTLAHASLHGPNLNHWPARTVDAFIALNAEEIRTDNAHKEAFQQR
jgi:hypothetical protein